MKGFAADCHGSAGCRSIVRVRDPKAILAARAESQRWRFRFAHGAVAPMLDLAVCLPRQNRPGPAEGDAIPLVLVCEHPSRTRIQGTLTPSDYDRDAIAADSGSRI